MAEDGLLFSIFGKVHPKFKTPTWGILIAGLMTAVLAGVFEVNQLVNMISIGTVKVVRNCLIFFLKNKFFSS